MDNISKNHRSWVMSRIPSKNPLPERTARSVLHRMGFRFRLHVKDLPGKPDLVFPLKLFLVRFPNAIPFSVKESLVGRIETPDFDLFYRHGAAEGIAMKTFG